MVAGRRRAVPVAAGLAVLLVAQPALAHVDQVIRFGSFLGGLTHPVLGLDHFIAMLSVGVVSAFIGGRAIWTVPASFVSAMALGGWLGWAGVTATSFIIETGIALSVIFLGTVILADRRLRTRIAMAAVMFFGFFHGLAHGTEIPDVARPFVYATGFLTGTILIHLLGVLLGDMARRYPRGRPVVRGAGGVFALVGILFMLGFL
jgi:urease accessory protein